MLIGRTLVGLTAVGIGWAYLDPLRIFTHSDRGLAPIPAVSRMSTIFVSLQVKWKDQQMSRRVFDYLASGAGIVVVVVLLVAGGLLAWGSSFVNDNVHSQLAQQQIYFPPKAAFAHPKAGTEITPSMIPSVSQYAGQQLLTGEQAKVWANDFMAVHLSNMPYHGIYSKVSAAAMANPKNTQLAALEDTIFRGTTLRGLLLEAYGFSVMGTVMMWGAIASFIAAALMAVLVGFGFAHARRTAPEKRLLQHKATVVAAS
jgi:hypothetical protein